MLKATPGLGGMMLLRRGMRLSIQPVTPQEWQTIVAMGGGPA
jgi:predicted RNA-binding protein with PUA-like domain